MKNEVRVAVTGAGGQIGYSLLFRLASGDVFGKDVGVHLHLLELPAAITAAEGVAMELEDCGFRNLLSVNCFDQADAAFKNINWALLVGSRPRGPGMERNDLIKVNGGIFVEQGKALNHAASNLRVVVVGNPCNTNALIALHNCREIPADRFTAMTALDENRSKAQLAKKIGINVGEINRLAIWGNHSSTMYPDFENAFVGQKPLTDLIQDRKWLEQDFIKIIQQRGAEIIKARGKSSAASAAEACIDHVKRMISKTPAQEWFSCAVPSDGRFYDIPKGLIFSFPVRSLGDGNYAVVENLKLSDFAKAKIKVSVDELLGEREVIKDLLSR